MVIILHQEKVPRGWGKGLAKGSAIDGKEAWGFLLIRNVDAGDD
jgi:hypothetical protein